MASEIAAVLHAPERTPAPRTAHGAGFLARIAAPSLKGAAATWFAVALAGQLMFATYVVGFYGRAAFAGEFERWNKVLPHGYVAGDTLGNLIVLSHLLFTVVVMLGGALQLVPAVRRRWPAFHRWNGRVYLVAVLVLAFGGLLMNAMRGTVGALSQTVAICINAVLVIAFARMAYVHARARRFDAHRRWALRLFLVVNGVFFLRIGVMFWILVNQGPVGFDPKSFSGPFITFASFAQYLLPLAVVELYFRAQASSQPSAKLAMAAALGVLALATAAGVAGASMMIWLPRL